MKNRIKFTALVLSGIFALICLFGSCKGSVNPENPANPDTPSDGKTYYTVTFDSDGGSTVASRKVESGTKVTRPDNPTKADYDFEGWFTGDTLYDFDTPVEANITLKAKWELATYTITFDSDGGSDVEEQYVKAGKTVQEPDAPSKQGYGFYGWYNGETEYDFSSAVHSDLTLKAKWGPVKAKEVTNENIVKTIKTLTESKSLKATGVFSNELISEVNKALKELYVEKPSVLVSLDLSEVTGLETLENCYSCYNPTNMEFYLNNPTVHPGIPEASENKSFCKCTNLESIILPKNLTSIGENAFYFCENLAKISIPVSVTNIGKWAFYNCAKLNEVSYNGTKQQYCAITFGNLYSNTCINNAVLNLGNTEETIIILPDTITTIDYGLFKGFEKLKSISIPDSVTSIKGSAFEGCTSLTSITIPDSVTSIEGSTFKGCTSLTSITIPDRVTSIKGSAFEGCTSLTSITIPDSVTSIGYWAFYGCSSLSSITISDSITSISGYAFMECSSLTTITIPNGVTGIGLGAFQNCSSLTSITIPYSVTSIGDYAFNNCSSLTSIIFENQTGWKAGDTPVSVDNPETNVTNLTETYIDKTWTRSSN